MNGVDSSGVVSTGMPARLGRRQQLGRRARRPLVTTKQVIRQRHSLARMAERRRGGSLRR